MDPSLLDEPVAVVPYDASWPDRFAQERQTVAAALGDLAVSIEHIGSTSVPGLAAKPIVDLLVGTRADMSRAAVVSALVPFGYEDVGLYLRRRGGHDFNVNLVEHGSPEWDRELLFRDYLRTHPDEARAYGELKVRAAENHGRLLAYAKEKRTFIDEMIERARAWRQSDHASSDPAKAMTQGPPNL